MVLLLDEREASVRITLKKMGYKIGSGLGKFEQGITDTIDIKYQSGKRGLGLHLENMKSATISWDFSKEDVNVKETVEWLHNLEESTHTFEEMLSWIREGPPDHDVQNQYNFCDKEVLLNVLKAKDIYDELDENELKKARARSNPFETIKSVFFMNRAALKIANIDAVTDFMFSNIDKDEYHKDHKGPFYFADVCAGPGGFTQYILWRKEWFFKGFGLTLKGEHDFNMNDYVCPSHVCFQPLYGKEEDGNVCSPENIEDFKNKVLHATDNQGVHFMMSDGGFSVEGNENLQEILSKNIYICQCVVALEIIRTHGHFVTKLFDTFTPFSVGLLYLMYKCFKKVTILKPNTSRPANSERYLICSSLKKSPSTENIKNYLKDIVNRLWDIKDKSDVDILEIVPLCILKEDQDFYRYIYETNRRLGIRQTMGLEKLATFCHNKSLVEIRQQECRTECLRFWNIPDEPKEPPKELKVDDLLNMAMHNQKILTMLPRVIKTVENFKEIFTDVEDWHYSPLCSSRNSYNIHFYAAVGSSRVFRLQKTEWTKLKNLQLCMGTLLYGEFVKERVINETKENSTFRYSLHVIDALRLGDKNVFELTFTERRKLIEIYCKSVNKEFHRNSVRIRPKVIDNLSNISSETFHTEIGQRNKYMNLPVMSLQCVAEKMDVNSLLFLKTNSNQTFYTTYFLRVQIFIDDEAESNCESNLSLNDIVSEIKQKL
nr:cap-specific mRNA (nucleoside-2'-O-)-methyltransferase 1 isoform X2 [Leptinotarsa decemlineata]